MVEEIRVLPKTTADPTAAKALEMLGSYTGMNALSQNNLHFRAVQTKLTPMLGSLTASLEDEVKHAMDNHFPSNTEWTTIKPYFPILDLVARSSARIFLGPSFCRSDKWLEISTQFTVQPKSLPSVRKTQRYIQQAQALLVPEILRRQELKASKTLDKNTEDTLLSWMMEVAQESESSPNDLAHMQLMLALAAIHTSQSSAVDILFDLAAHPDDLDQIREEIREAASESDGWQKASYAKLRKLDSFMKESQRVHPPRLLSAQRMMMQENHVLSDGTALPKGSM
ncbi:MAG: hypothetical protein Q9224_005790, partial [Gallowayella concinna]